MTMTARPGRGGELAAALLAAAERLRGFPGCEIYVIGRNASDPDTMHVTEVWRDEASAQAALSAPRSPGGPSPTDVLALLSGPPERTDLTVLGGVGPESGGHP